MDVDQLNQNEFYIEYEEFLKKLKKSEKRISELGSGLLFQCFICQKLNKLFGKKTFFSTRIEFFNHMKNHHPEFRKKRQTNIDASQYLEVITIDDHSEDSNDNEVNKIEINKMNDDDQSSEKSVIDVEDDSEHTNDDD